MTKLLARTLRRLRGGASGGTLPASGRAPGGRLVLLSPGGQIADPGEAEALGLTATARPPSNRPTR